MQIDRGEFFYASQHNLAKDKKKNGMSLLCYSMNGDKTVEKLKMVLSPVSISVQNKLGWPLMQLF